MSLQSYSRIQAHDTANDTKVSKPNTLIIIIKTIVIIIIMRDLIKTLAKKNFKFGTILDA